MRQLHEVEKHALEHMVDVCGLSTVLTAIEHISYEKADHISANYNDQGLAQMWSRAGGAIRRATQNEVFRQLSR